MGNFEDSYVGWLRKYVGKARLIIPVTRAIVRDDQGQVLIVQRRDNRTWGLPAGSIELGESVMDCLRREVSEESGLTVISATPIALHTEPRFDYTNMYGDEYQRFVLVFCVDQWTGELQTNTEETVDARFFPLDALPDIPPHHHESLEDLRQFIGRLIVK
ncbi:MAG: NUDIX domain-containing protein [Dehalococcoidia bacterium]|nr:NUDIX domain-containing protein [Dehalococcoidia bacterium]